MVEPNNIIKNMTLEQVMHYSQVKPDGIHCKGCGEPKGTFNDEVSAKEYEISGLCQTCQDEAFAPEPDDIFTPEQIAEMNTP